MVVADRNHYMKVDLKRKHFAKGRGQRFKRFKKTAKFIQDNVENQVAKQKAKDVFDFSDSEDERANELGMGLDITDLQLQLLDDQEKVIALTQDSVRPFFPTEASYDQSKLNEALVDLKYTSFRPNQEETIKRILFGRSTLFISPTGSGKSLCYQLPALLYWRYKTYITIVVSPLISLMEDQMNNIPSSLKAVRLHFGQNKQQKKNIIQQLANGEAQVLFVSPEAIVGGILELDDLRSFPPVGFVCIDEAHCLSEWSHNFRPAYLQFFKILSEQLNIKTFLGLTATASRATTFAISRCLTINPETDVIGATIVPENLILSVSYERNKELALIALLKSPTFIILPSIIIYCNTRQETENVASIVRTAMRDYSTIVQVPERIKRGSSDRESQVADDGHGSSPNKPQMKLAWNAESYHAGLTTATRKSIQKRFVKGEIRVVVATIAFGMGINKANVRAIIHYDMPGSFESYVQEIGRAGRDGKPAQCHMFLRSDKTDVFYQQRNIYSSTVEMKNIKKLVDYIFKPCRCVRNWYMAEKEVRDKLDKLNKTDTHEISCWQETSFTDTPKQCTDEDVDDHNLIGNDNNIFEKSDKPIKYVHKSVVDKHRVCPGHEVSFSIDEAKEGTNLNPESIITFICQIQQAYPQLKIKQFTPLKSQCNLHCYKGPQQMEELDKKCPAVRDALFMHKQHHLKTQTTPYEIPNKLSFEITGIATRLSKPTAEIIKMLKKTEWELVEKTGRFRRSQVRVGFEGNSFHLFSVGDLSDPERGEIEEFLIDYMKKYEVIQRNKVLRVYNVFKRHSIDVDSMNDKIIRLQTSMKLKTALNTYFNPDDNQFIAEEIMLHKESDDDKEELPAAKHENIIISAREFISSNGVQHTPRAIARIFQGISCPNYPAEIWGANRKWWRIHPDVDFLKLLSIIKQEWIDMLGELKP